MGNSVAAVSGLLSAIVIGAIVRAGHHMLLVLLLAGSDSLTLFATRQMRTAG